MLTYGHTANHAQSMVQQSAALIPLKMLLQKRLVAVTFQCCTALHKADATMTTAA